jgi:hypothetical protein
MITGVSMHDGKRIVLLGVTRENIDRLVAGKPIRVTAETHPGFPTDLVISIAFGEDERVLTEQLQRAGVIGKHTKVIGVPREPGSVS